MHAAAHASHREELASVRTVPVKAELRTQTGASALRDLAADAIRATSGNARAAAIDLGIHEGHLSRQLKDGSLRLEQLETLGAPLLAELGRQLLVHYGALASPEDRADQTIRDLRGK